MDKVTGSSPVIAIQLRANVTARLVDVQASKQNEQSVWEVP